MSLVRQITSLEGGGGRNLESPVSQPVPIPPCLFLHCASSLLSMALQLSNKAFPYIGTYYVVKELISRGSGTF